MTWLRRTLLAAATALLALALVAPVVAQESADPDDGRPPVFQAKAFTTALHANLNTKPAQTVPDIIRVDVPHGQSLFQAGGVSQARASTLYPGLTVAEGANLLCVAGFPCSDMPGFPPQYPFNANAEYPTRIDAAAPADMSQVGDETEGGSGGQFSFRVNEARAHAGRDYVSTDAVVTDLKFIDMGPDAADVPGHTDDPYLVHIGRLEAHTLEQFDGDVLVAHAESRLSDVSLFAGAVRIESIVSKSTSLNDGGEVLETNPKVTVKGVTVGGVPATITEDGLELAGGPCPVETPEIHEQIPGGGAQVCADDQGALALLASGLEEFFSNGENELRLLSEQVQTSENRIIGDVTGLMIHTELDGSGLPGAGAVVVDLMLGQAVSDVQVSLDDPADFGTDFDFDFDDDFGAGTDVSGGGDFGAGADGSGGGDFASVGGQQVTDGGTSGRSGPAVSPAGSTQGQTFVHELLGAAAANRVQLLYGAWALAVVGLAAGSRLRPVRLAAR